MYIHTYNFGTIWRIWDFPFGDLIPGEWKLGINNNFWSSFHILCENINVGNLKYLNIVFILNDLIKYRRLNELHIDNIKEKAIYGAGFINWIIVLCILLRERRLWIESPQACDLETGLGFVCGKLGESKPGKGFPPGIECYTYKYVWLSYVP